MLILLLPVFVLVGSFGFSVTVEAAMASMQDDHCGQMEMMDMQAEGDDHCLRCYGVDATVVNTASQVSQEVEAPVVQIQCPEPKHVQRYDRPRKQHKRQRLKEHLCVQPRE